MAEADDDGRELIAQTDILHPADLRLTPDRIKKPLRAAHFVRGTGLERPRRQRAGLPEKDKRTKENLRMKKLHKGVTTLTAAFMCCLIPLLVHDGYHDISTVKVKALILGMPCLAALFFLSCVLNREWPGRRLQEQKQPLLFLAFSVLSWCCCAALHGFSDAVMQGAGRSAGLVFLLCCGAGCFCIATGDLHEQLFERLLLLSGAGIAALGILSAMGIDPLGMYEGIDRSFRLAFLSTIGNSNFYGCALLFSFSQGASMWVSGAGRSQRVLGLSCVLIIGAGICCSLADTAILGLLLSGPVLLYLNWGKSAAMQRAVILTGVCLLLLPGMQQLLLDFSPLYIEFPGLYAFVASGEVLLPGVLLLSGGYCLIRKCASAGTLPPRPGLLEGMLCLALAALLIIAAGLLRRLNLMGIERALEEPLEFNLMALGGGRGYIYRACLRAYRHFPLPEKLLGCGLDSLEPAVEPYLSDRGRRFFPVGSILNDAHCQPLHFLLTGGLAGFAAWTGFYLSCLMAMGAKRKRSPFSDGVYLGLLLFLPCFLLNVAQPVLLILYMGMAGAGLSCLASER